MGSHISAEERSVVCIFIKHLDKRGIKFDEHSLCSLLAWLKSKGIAVDAQIAFCLETWELVREVLWGKAINGDNTITKLLTTWKLVTDSLKQLKEDRVTTVGTGACLSECDSRGVELPTWSQPALRDSSHRFTDSYCTSLSPWVHDPHAMPQ